VRMLSWFRRIHRPCPVLSCPAPLWHPLWHPVVASQRPVGVGAARWVKPCPVRCRRDPLPVWPLKAASRWFHACLVGGFPAMGSHEAEARSGKHARGSTLGEARSGDRCRESSLLPTDCFSVCRPPRCPELPADAPASVSNRKLRQPPAHVSQPALSPALSVSSLDISSRHLLPTSPPGGAMATPAASQRARRADSIRATPTVELLRLPAASFVTSLLPLNPLPPRHFDPRLTAPAPSARSDSAAVVRTMPQRFVA
jgi:hypothetical protein